MNFSFYLQAFTDKMYCSGFEGSGLQIRIVLSPEHEANNVPFGCLLERNIKRTVENYQDNCQILSL